jgi:hypothetical protein
VSDKPITEAEAAEVLRMFFGKDALPELPEDPADGFEFPHSMVMLGICRTCGCAVFKQDQALRKHLAHHLRHGETLETKPA